MTERSKILLAIIIMILSFFIINGINITILHDTALEEHFVKASVLNLTLTLILALLGADLFIRIRRRIKNLEQHEAVFRRIFEQADVGLAQIRTSTSCFVRVNRKYCDLVGYSREEMERLDFKSITHPDDLQADLDNMELLKAGKISEFTMEKRYYRKDGSVVWVDLAVSPMRRPGETPDFHIAVVQDISERRQLDEHIRKLNRIYTVLSNINQAIVRVRDVETLFKDVCRIAVEDGGFASAGIGLFDPDSLQVIPAACAGAYPEKSFIFPDQQADTGLSPALREGQHIICNDITAYPHSTDRNEELLRHGFRSFAAFPLKVSGNVRGIISLYASEPASFIADEVKLLDELAMDVSFAMAFFEEEAARHKAQKALLKSRLLYHDLVETSQDLIWQCDILGRYTYLNPAWESAFGYKLEEMLGKKFTDFQEHDIAARSMAEFDKLIQGNTMKGFETVHIGKQGNPIYLVFKAKFVKDEKGCIIGARGTAYDISDRVQAESRYRALFEDAPMMYVITRNMEGIPIIADCNGLFLSTLNYSREEVLGQPLDRFYSPLSREKLFEGGYRRALEGEFDSEERELLTREGHIVATMLRTAPEMDGGKVCGTRAMYIDITEQKQMRNALTESEMRFRQIYEHVEVGLARVSLDFRIEHANQAYCRMLGYGDTEIIGKHLRDITHPESIEDNLRKQQQLARGDIDHYRMEKQFFHKQGHTVSALLAANLIRDASGKPKYFLGSLVDITERKLAEASLSASEKKYRLLFYSMLDAFALHEIICDAQGNPCDYRFLEVNPAFEGLTGLKAENIIGKKVLDVLPGTEACWISTYGKVALTGDPIHFENYSAELDKYYEVTAYCPEKGQFAAIFSDISDRKRAEEERLEMERRLLHAQKLESLGVMAGGIAHDFNNLLMAIMGNIDLTLYNLPPKSSARISLAEALKAAERAADLTGQMLAYSGKGIFSFEYIDLSERVAENAAIFKTAVSGSVSLKLDLSEDLPLIKADPGQIQQVIMNLIINASEAVGEKIGFVTLITKITDCDENCLARSYLKEKPSAGKFICLEVSDTGCGMDEDTKKRLFDPFFTTKFTGRGLGMSAVLGIVRSHKGAIFIESEPGRGTKISVLFPVSESESAESDSKATGLRSHPELSESVPLPGIVMVADDEDAVRELYEAMLVNIGYRTLAAENGEEAVKLFRKHADEIICVILDLTMPGMDGVSAFRELRRIRSDVIVILSSGYSEHEVSRRFDRRDIAGFLQKPFKLEELRYTLKSVLKKQLAG